MSHPPCYNGNRVVSGTWEMWRSLVLTVKLRRGGNNPHTHTHAACKVSQLLWPQAGGGPHFGFISCGAGLAG